jgi:dTDP-4-amino-4,6-dideoxygalactose transaminase
VTDQVGKEILSLPLHSKMSLETVAEVCKQVKAYFQDKQA